MLPRERRETGTQDLFRSRLDQIINMNHELVRLAKTVSWETIEARCGEVYSDGPGMPPLPTRLMAGLAILKHTFDLSDEELCARWVENPYFQFFCGEEFFLHELPFDRSSLTRWRQRMGEERIAVLLQESLAVAVKTGAMAPQDTRRVIIDTTVQPKNVMFRRQAVASGAREAGGIGEEGGSRPAPVLCAGRQVRPHPAPAISPCQTVQARQQGIAHTQDLSGPHHPGHRPADRG
jgi:hypothetical protein